MWPIMMLFWTEAGSHLTVILYVSLYIAASRRIEQDYYRELAQGKNKCPVLRLC